jgi:hypothetical protein
MTNPPNEQMVAAWNDQVAASLEQITEQSTNALNVMVQYTQQMTEQSANALDAMGQQMLLVVTQLTTEIATLRQENAQLKSLLMSEKQE